MSMITPGRRAMGEGWRKVTITPDPNTGQYLIDNEPTEAPADKTPIFVPGLGNISVEMADFILERERDRARDRAKQPKQEDIKKEVNQAWQDFCADKIQWFKGRTVTGPGGMYQRERSRDRHG